MGWLYLAVAIVTEVIGTSALAPSQGFTKPVPTIIVLVSYAAAFYLLSQTLHTIPVAVAYAVWSGAGIALSHCLGDVRPAPRCLRASWHRTYRRRRAGDPYLFGCVGALSANITSSPGEGTQPFRQPLGSRSSVPQCRRADTRTPRWC